MEIREEFVADQGLVEAAVAVESFEGCVVYAVFEAEEEVEVAEADVGVDEDDREGEARERETEIGGGGGFADAAFAGGDDGDAGRGTGELGLATEVAGDMEGRRLGKGEEAGWGHFRMGRSAAAADLG